VLVVVLRVSRRGRRRRAVAEELLSRAEVATGKKQQTVLVDQVVRDERLRELAAAVDLQLISRPLLELGDLGARSPPSSEELCQPTASSVVEATYFGRAFELPAIGSRRR